MPDTDGEAIGELIKRERRERGMTQDMLAAALLEVSGAPCGEGRSIHRWEVGKRIPQRYWRTHLATVLNVRRETLDRAAAVAHAQRANHRRLGGPNQPDHSWSDSRTSRESALRDLGWADTAEDACDDAVRLIECGCEPGPVGPEGVSSVAFRWLVRPVEGATGRRDEYRRVGSADVQRLRATRRTLKRVDDAYGGGTSCPKTLAFLRGEVAPLLNARYDDATGRQLLEITAELVLDTGWAAYDAADDRMARRYLLHALRLSHAAGNRLLGGRVMAALSHHALHVGEVRLAVDLARAARLGTSTVAPPRVAAMLAAMEGCAHAAENNRSWCTAALVDAENALGRLGSDDPTDDAKERVDFDEGGLWGHAARAYRDLAAASADTPNSAAPARRYAERAVEQCHQDHSRTRAQRNVILATTHLQLGDIEQASAVGDRVLTDTWQLDSNRVLADITRLIADMPPTPAARDFIGTASTLLAAKKPAHHG